jgi:hypothetical protein
MGLTGDAVELLFQVLELPESVLSGAAIELHPAASERLIKAKLLVAHDFEEVSSSQSDHDDALVSLFWSEKDHALAYFSPKAGIVPVPSQGLARYRVDFDAVLAAALAELDLPSKWTPSVVVADLVWELRDVRFGRSKTRSSPWFVRRLWSRDVQRHVLAATKARPDPYQRVILTSSRPDRVHELSIPGAIIIPIRDVLSSVNRLAISGDIVHARLTGAQTPPNTAVALSPDGTQLRIHGREPISFKSDRHIAAIRSLVKAWEKGHGVPVRELTEHGTLRRHFGAVRWQLLSPYIKSVNGLWTFVV